MHNKRRDWQICAHANAHIHKSWEQEAVCMRGMVKSMVPLGVPYAVRKKKEHSNLEDTILAPACDNPPCLNLEIQLTSASKEMGRGVLLKGL